MTSSPGLFPGGDPWKYTPSSTSKRRPEGWEGEKKERIYNPLSKRRPLEAPGGVRGLAVGRGEVALVAKGRSEVVRSV